MSYDVASERDFADCRVISEPLQQRIVLPSTSLPPSSPSGDSLPPSNFTFAGFVVINPRHRNPEGNA